MRRLRFNPAVEMAILLVGLAAPATSAQAEGLMDIPKPTDRVAVTAERSLQLNVVINESPVNLIGSFQLRPDGSLAATPQELREIGLIPTDEAIGSDSLVRLDRLPGVSYRVDEAKQTVRITAPDAARAPHIVNVRPKADGHIGPQRSYGGVLNYTLFASSDGAFWRDLKSFQGLSGAFDGRVFSPYGTFSQSAIASTVSPEFGGLTRLDSTWTYSDTESLITYRGGDTISGGLSWTRSVRLGGVQMQTNFALRPDLVTLPIPALSGSAAVPSTLDVYTQNVKTYTGSVPAGPFQVTNLPIATGAGTASVVLNDALGRQIVTTLPFYVSSQLLRVGLYDFSAELGFARRFYGIESHNYDARPVGSASVRYGLTNSLTLEGHAEGGAGLVNGGLGAAFSLGAFGAASFAVAGSQVGDRAGGLFNASLETSFWGLSLYARTQRTFGNYGDIASVTAPILDPKFGNSSFFSALVPKALDQVTFSMRLPFDRSNLGLSYTQLESALGDRNRIVGLSFSRTFFRDSTIFATAFKDIDAPRSFGIFAGISVPFRNDVTVSTGVQSGPTGTSVVTDAMKSERLETGSYGARVRDAEGSIPDRSARASYRASFGRIEAGVQQYGNATRATAQIDGSIAFAGGGVFFGNRIDDAFAVVNAGAPNVAVQYENRPVGVTDSRGLLLVPYLNSYQKNKISIDPKNLPVDADVPSTHEAVVPADRSGVVVNFGILETPRAALVTFTDGKGKPLAVGAQGHLESGQQTFVIGYDGQGYVQGLTDQNIVAIDLPDSGSCRAAFGYAPKPGEQVALKDVVCQ
ncbi:outer membrane usher protein [Bradyrhizobium sp. USDA 3240]